MKTEPPKTRDWKAHEDRQPGPSSGPTLHVSGEFEASNSNQTGGLKERVPQGINPKILLLDLHIESSGAGRTVIDWQHTEPFSKKVTAGQYERVEILWQDQKLGGAGGRL